MGPSGSRGEAGAWLGGSWNRRASRAAQPPHPVTMSLPQRTVPRHSFLAHLEAWVRKRHLWLSTPHLPTWKREVLHNDTLRDQGNTGRRVTTTHRGRPPGEEAGAPQAQCLGVPPSRTHGEKSSSPSTAGRWMSASYGLPGLRNSNEEITFLY